MDARNGSVMHFWALFRVVVLKLTKGSFVMQRQRHSDQDRNWYGPSLRLFR